MAGSRMSEVEVYKSRLERTVKIQLASEVVPIIIIIYLLRH